MFHILIPGQTVYFATHRIVLTFLSIDLLLLAALHSPEIGLRYGDTSTLHKIELGYG